MTGIASVLIDRSGMAGAPADLTIGSSAPDTYRLRPDGLGQPANLPRTAFADPSAFLPGGLPTNSVLENSNLLLEVKVLAATEAALTAAVDDLKAAVDQLMYAVGVTIDGVSRTYRAFPATATPTKASRKWHDVESHTDYWTLVIPIFPIPEAT